MYVKKILLQNYRNIEYCFLEPIEGVNIIYGENGQGKTNLLEAMWLFTGGKSFRRAKEAQLISFDKNKADMQMTFFAENREQNARIILSDTDKKKIFLNDIEKKSSASLVGSFTSVVFSPVHLTLVSGSPAERRRFLDTAICQIYPSYVKIISDYQRALIQRNSLLKDIKYHSELIDTLENWNEQLIENGIQIIIKRREFIERLKTEAEAFYEGISSSKECLGIEYYNIFTAAKENLKNKYNLAEERKYYRSLLNSSIRQDMFTGTTSIGAHRDDMILQLNNVPAKEFGSQGQQRSVALSLKLAECEILSSELGEPPVVLLDDVMSELDENRQNYILNNIKDKQIFITCCDEGIFKNTSNVTFFRTKKGTFNKESVTC